MSTTSTQPAPIRLPGQAAAPEGPADMTMMYVMHHAFRRDLARFATAVSATPLEDREAWQALSTRWDRFLTVLHHHHTAEDDFVWPYLLERADAAEREVLDAMEAEHEEIDPLLAAVAEGFGALAGAGLPADAEDLRAALRVRVAATQACLVRHLEHEETGAIPILQRHTTTAEWHHIEKEQLAKRKVPVPMLFMVGWCAEDVPARQREQIFGQVGVGFKVLWLLTRRSFRRGEQRAFRYAA
jgi:hypothetical protein